MGFYIRELKNKRQAPHWKVQFLSHKKAETKDSTAKRPRKEWDISKERWGSLGFQPAMSSDQARARAKQLNAQRASKWQEERRKKFNDLQKDLNQKFTASIPELYKEEFELKYLTGRFQNPGWKKRFFTNWNATQKMLIEVQLDPVDWYDNYYLFYDYFCKQQYSFSYICKILVTTNLWGHFLSRKLGQSFTKLQIPKGSEKARLLDAYFKKCGQHVKQSDPVTPAQLERVKSKIKKENYNWLYLSVWLGLRPQEIDQLKDEQYVRLQKNIGGAPTLWVYQTKLVSVPPRYRWKLIPIIFKEQKEALKIIRSKNFRRPIAKIIKKYFGPHTTLYGGRKGFTDLMLSNHQDFIHISQWMGHSSIERTWRNYKSRTIVHHNLQHGSR